MFVRKLTSAIITAFSEDTGEKLAGFFEHFLKDEDKIKADNELKGKTLSRDSAQNRIQKTLDVIKGMQFRLITSANNKPESASLYFGIPNEKSMLGDFQKDVKNSGCFYWCSDSISKSFIEDQKHNCQYMISNLRSWRNLLLKNNQNKNIQDIAIPSYAYCFRDNNSFVNVHAKFAEFYNCGGKEICKQAYENPHFWRFNSGYSKYANITKNTHKFLLQNDNSVGGNVYNVYDNLPLKSLLKNVFDNELPRLWVPPVSAHKYGTGKTLVFTRMAVSTRCVAYYCDKYAQELVEKFTDYDNNTIDDGTISSLLENTKIKKALCEFFNRPFVRRVICAANNKFKWGCTDYNEAIKEYCEEYRFKDMINEWLYIKDNDVSIICSAFTHKPTSIKTFDSTDSEIKIRYVNPEYSEMFVCDDNKSGERTNVNNYKTINPEEHQTAKKLEEICDQFNSPIYPMILVARNSAQEGFNLQYYGDKIMHWQSASTVTAFLQREGRLNRPNSLTLRHKVWQWACYLKNVKPSDYSEAVKTLDERIDDVKKAHDKNILTPVWYLNSPYNCNKVEIKQILPIYEYNDKLDDYSRELAAAQKYLSSF